MSFPTTKATELRAAFLEGRLAKSEYIDAMFNEHVRFVDYARLLEGSDIEQIVVNSDEVVFRTRRDGLYLTCRTADKRTAPFEILNFGAYEGDEGELLMSLVPPNATVFDVGANIGWYALGIGKRNPQARVFSFEPVPDTYAALQRNLKANPQIQNVEAFPFGFGEADGSISFYYDPDFSSKSSAANLAASERTSRIDVQLLRLDDFVTSRGIEKVDFIKCDVEGAELFVYRGGRQTIERDRPIVFSEMLRKWAAKFQYHPNDIIELFAGWGYRCFAVQGSQLVPCPQVTDETQETNFVCFLAPG